jgi:hypothetical protein
VTTYNAFFDPDGRLAIVTSKPGTGFGDGPMFAGVSPADSTVAYTGYEVELDDDLLREEASGRREAGLVSYLERLVRDDRASLTPARLLTADGIPADLK